MPKNKKKKTKPIIAEPCADAFFFIRTMVN